MEQLIQICSRELAPGQKMDTVNARDLWKFLTIGKDFSTWIKVQISRAKLIDGKHFITSSAVPPQGGPVYLEYFLTVEAAKQVGMISETDRGFQIRDYFIECERRLKADTTQRGHDVQGGAPFDPSTVFEDPAAMRGLLLTYCDKVIELKQRVEEQAPKVEALNRIAQFSEGSLCITDAAKSLQVSPKVLFVWLQAHDWIYRRSGSHWIAYQPKLKQGYLEHKVTPVKRKNVFGVVEDTLTEQVRVTAKGLAYLATALSMPTLPS